MKKISLASLLFLFSTIIFCEATIDISDWKTLKNDGGWELKYPATWQASGQDGADETTDLAPHFAGPMGCCQEKKECGSIEIELVTNESMARSYNSSDLTPREFIDAAGYNSQREIIDEKEAPIDGHPACEVWSKDDSGIYLNVALKTEKGMFAAAFSENTRYGAAPKNPDQWTLTPIFYRMISTLKLDQ